jgi:hypothetical protein
MKYCQICEQEALYRITFYETMESLDVCGDCERASQSIFARLPDGGDVSIVPIEEVEE